MNATQSEQVRRYVARLDAERRRPLREQLEDDVATYRGLTPEARARVVADVCRAAWVLVKSRPDSQKAIAWQDPPSADFPEKWKALMRRRRSEVPLP